MQIYFLGGYTPLLRSIADERKGSGGFQRAPTDAGTFAGAKVRLAKIAQCIAIFRLSAVAPYLRTPEEESFEPAPSTQQYSR